MWEDGEGEEEYTSEEEHQENLQEKEEDISHVSTQVAVPQEVEAAVSTSDSSTPNPADSLVDPTTHEYFSYAEQYQPSPPPSSSNLAQGAATETTQSSVSSSNRISISQDQQHTRSMWEDGEGEEEYTSEEEHQENLQEKEEDISHVSTQVAVPQEVEAAVSTSDSSTPNPADSLVDPTTHEYFSYAEQYQPSPPPSSSNLAQGAATETTQSSVSSSNRISISQDQTISELEKKIMKANERLRLKVCDTVEQPYRALRGGPIPNCSSSLASSLSGLQDSLAQIRTSKRNMLFLIESFSLHKSMHQTVFPKFLDSPSN
eukprot:TRINITY_DN3873_c0_g1_i1.p1 TRINITY_DN3873_c0_g1~~TRINITY_DN3873_c0_g1_i1.p1  ORF type:complete len:329 (-),score=110.46 TRINITY_DN3873_c0_g1_i1:56-1006(-)